MKLKILYDGRPVGFISPGQTAIVPKGKKFTSDIVIRAVADTVEPDEEVIVGTEGLGYTLSDDGTYYTCSGIGTATDVDIVIANKIDGVDVKIIRDHAFSSCSNLTSVTIPDSVTSIGAWAFIDCSNLTSVIIPDSVTTMGEWVFSGCSNLTSVVIGDSITSINNRAFYYCTSLGSLVIPDSVITIGDEVFVHCESLTSVEIGDSVTSIGAWAFSGCSNLTSITIPDSVTTIGERVFYDCTSLASITIPESVVSISADAFRNCNNLANVYYTGTAEQWSEILIGSGNSPLTSATIHYNIISFTIDRTTYYAEEGMTWAEWVADTAYNTDGYYKSNPDDAILEPSSGLCINGDLGLSGKPIIADAQYTLHEHNHSGGNGQ